MPAAKSTATSAAATPAPAASVAAPAAAAAPSAAPKAARKGKAVEGATPVKAAAAAAAAPAPVAAPAPAPVVAAPVAAAPAPTNTVVEGGAAAEPVPLAQLFDELSAQFVALRKQLTAVTSQFSALRTRAERDLRHAQKKVRKHPTGEKKKSGFVMPAPISAELAAFLGKPEGTEIARTEVTKEINTYIREHNLKDPENGRHINPDSRLRKLLQLPSGVQLTYFNLQHHLAQHFPKPKAAQEAAAAASTGQKA